MKRTTKILSVLLVFCLLLSAVPMRASAQTNMNESEPNDSKSTADRIYDDYYVSARLDGAFGSDSMDYYKFVLNSSCKVLIMTMSLADGVGFRLDSSSGYVCGSTKDGTYGGYYVDIIERTLSPGTYYISVVSSSMSGTTYYMSLNASGATTSHSHSYTPSVTKPTCTKEGYTTYICSCGDKYTGNKVAATGHTFGEWSLVTAPTATADGQEHRLCTVCKFEETKAIPAGTHYHIYGRWVTVKKPSATEEGLRERTCECGEKQQEVMPIATGKSFAEAMPMEFGETITKTFKGQSGSIIVSSEEKFYMKVEVPQNGYISIHNQEALTNGTAYWYGLSVYDEEETLCWTTGLSGSTYGKPGFGGDTVRNVGLAAGTYYVVLECSTWSLRNDLTGEHKITFTPTENYEREPNNKEKEATPLRVGTTYSAASGDENKSADIWLLEVDEAFTAKLYLSNMDILTNNDYAALEYRVGGTYGSYQYYHVQEDDGGKYVELNVMPDSKFYITVENDVELSDYTIRVEKGHVHTPGAPLGEIKATCEEDGSINYGCTECNFTWWEFPPALGHNWDEGKVTTEATDLVEGVKTYTCSNCDGTRTEAIPKLEHTHRHEASQVAPTCTEKGYTAYICPCGDTYKENEVDALGHTWQEVMCGEQRACTVCGEKDSTVQQHEWKDATCTMPKVCGICNTTSGVSSGHNFVDGTCTKCQAVQPEGDRVYGIGETWIVDGQWEFTVNSVSKHSRCNSSWDQVEEIYSGEVLKINYTYKNIGYSSSSGLRVYSLNFDVYDENFEALSSYACRHCADDKACKVTGSKCTADEAYLVTSNPKVITLVVEIRRTENGKVTSTYETATFSLYTVDANGNQEHTHDWVDADCSKPMTCAVCGAFEGVTADHAWVEADCENPKTCTACGLVEGEALGHAWVDADCENPKTCTACGETEGEALGHAWVDADCENPKTCTTCSKVDGEPLGHTWLEATCTTAKTCTTCNKVEGEALGHSWEEAACTEPKTCTACGFKQGEAAGHQWADADCEKPKTCTACGETEGEALGHTWVDADCEHAKTCSVCNKTDGKPLGHTWVDADCEHAKTCEVCDKTEGEALGHSWKDATCTAAKTCSVCGKTDGKPLGHDYKDNICTRCGAEKPKYVLGDVNGDGKINVTDAMVTLRYAVKKITANDLIVEAADVNVDGKVNVTDAMQILRFAVKKITEFKPAK